MALMQAIRDTGLPMPAGSVLISPWLDLTHSLPSCQDNEITDYLPPSFSIIKKQQHNDNAQTKGTDYHHIVRPATDYCGLLSDDTVDQLHPYTHNRCLKHPLVSPLFDRYQWHGFPPLLIQVGDAEQLRDESICASFYATDQFDATPPCLPTTTHHRPLKPTLITLDLYDDQPHVFQILMSSKAVRRSVLEMASFLHDITLKCDSYKPLTDPHPLTIRSISPTGWIDHITEDMLKVHYGDIWQDWQDRLDNTSLKARLKYAVASRL
jgi:acetyl esterase/lipase